MNNSILNLLLAIIPVVSALITGFLLPYIKQKTTYEQRANALLIVEVAVKSAEQLYKVYNKNFDRKKWVLEQLQGMNLNLTEEELDMFIEAIVHELNTGQ